MENQVRFVDVALDAIDVDGGAAGRAGLASDEDLLADGVSGTVAEIGWLMRPNQHEPATYAINKPTRILLSSLTDFPKAPDQLIVVGSGSSSGPWTEWCQHRGIGSCIVGPIPAGPDRPGVLGFLAQRPALFGQEEMSRVAFLCRVLARAERPETGVERLSHQLAELRGAFATGLAIRANLHQPSYRRLASSVGEILDATYIHIALVDSHDCVSIMGSGGHRPPQPGPAHRWPLGQLTQCAVALSTRCPIVLDHSNAGSCAEQELMFNASTKVGIIVPFVSAPHLKGLLLVAEERACRFPPAEPGRLALLELVASRVAEILALSQFLKNMRASDRGRQIRVGEVAERRRLAQAVHDDVGQALTALLLRIRWAIGQSRTSTDELRVFEATARDALEATRALAFRLRLPAQHGEPIQLARDYTEQLLDAVRCHLSWVDQRAPAPMDPEVARELGRVIRESVTNIARHSRADAVEVRLESPQGLVRVTIRDNGSGFSPSTVGLTESGEGLGLLENRESLETIGGTFAVTSSAKGTLVIAEAPRRRSRRRW